ncbi:hypothetical protein THALO_270002 [Tenacibaculum halocynthiae]|nr:hypothetical protein SAMN04487765_0199 [Tenacibaculum sp. MAR_2010_89]
MKSGKTNTNYYTAIKKFLGIKKDALNSYMREQLELESTK